MRLFYDLDMHIKTYEDKTGVAPDLYFIRSDMLNTLLAEKEFYPNPTLVHLDEISGFYQYKGTWLIPVDDQFLKQFPAEYQVLKNYKFIDDKPEWNYKVPITLRDGQRDYLSVRKSVLKEFNKNIERFEKLLS
ncbi:hypothetical protein [Acinetobacter indicus]|uniref:hypothetical protein n=1 Tax=Acinetobacter indicus TaxID=756892 RepID=UPI002575CA84|nr:hypothetical protein [Acinetobacter indicus]MDM1272622.1 hypothetical protein [Acinetobacter indicus]